MRKPAFALALFFFVFQDVFPQDSVAFRYAGMITGSGLRPHVEVLASDSLEGRETGRRGQKKAAAYIADYFQSAGLQPVVEGGHVQYTYLSARANAGKNFVVNEKNFVFMRDYFYPPGLCDSLLVVNEAAFAGYGIAAPAHDDYRATEAKDKTVLIFEGHPHKKSDVLAPAERSVSKKINNAKAKGASAALIITDSLQSRIVEHSYRSARPENPGIPFAFITREVAAAFFPGEEAKYYQKALKKITQAGRPAGFSAATDAQLRFVKNTDEIRGENVMGILEGTDKKEEVVVITAHYDHLGKRDSLVYYGADDNASGTSAVMEIAKQFSIAAQNGHRPRRSLLFMAVSGEEKGLLGSNYYVKYPPVALANTVANLNTDMIGRIDPVHDSLNVREYIYIIGSDKLSTELHQINEKANAGFTKLELDYTYNKPDDPNRFYYRSDHYNFARNNIPSIFYFNGSHADYHKPSDTAGKIQYDLLAKRAQLIFLTAWELANREERIRVDVMSDMPDKREE